MNTPNKGDILAERIEHYISELTEKGIVFEASRKLSQMLAEYRAHWTLGRTVNGFTLGDGQERLRQDGWTENHHDYSRDGKFWTTQESSCECKPCHYRDFIRTRRPLPAVEKKPILTPEQIADGWVEWHGGGCPVWGGSKLSIVYRSGYPSIVNVARNVRWLHLQDNGDIIAYRPDPYAELKQARSEGKVIQCLWSTGWKDLDEVIYWDAPVKQYRVKPEPVIVPLGPEDVPPGSVVRSTKSVAPKFWISVLNVISIGAEVAGNDGITTLNFSRLKDECWEISRDGGKTWSRCEKEAK